MPSRRALTAILTRRGFTIVATLESAEALLRAAGGTQANVILLDLSLAGVAGVRIVPALLTVAPGCAVILLSPFGGLRGAAVEAGAYDLVDPSDLRDLERCLDRLSTETRVDGPAVEATLGPHDEGARTTAVSETAS